MSGEVGEDLIVNEGKPTSVHLCERSSLQGYILIVQARVRISGLNPIGVSYMRLLIERFDREHTGDGWTRRSMVSALTMFEPDELMARYASYEELATMIRHRFTEPKKSVKELFSRIVFNILSGNTDDHARNHCVFWNGSELALTPAYDVCPQARAGGEASQAMLEMGRSCARGAADTS